MDHPITVIDGIRQSDWIEQSGVPRTAAFRLLKIAGVEAEMRRVPGLNKPQPFLLPEHLKRLEPLVQRFLGGVTLRELEEQSTALVAVGGNAERLATVGAGGQQLATVSDGGQPLWVEPLVERLAPLLPAPVEPDPLKTARRLEEAARLNVPLSQSEVAMLLNLSLATIENWTEDREVRPGFWVRRQFDGRRVWWMVRDERQAFAAVPNRSEPPATVRTIGFDDVVAAAHQGQTHEVTLLVRGPILPVLC